MTTQKLPSTYKAVRAAPDKDKDPIIDEVPLKMPGRDQVLVKIAYSPLNPTDLLSGKRQVPGYSQDGELIGSEGSGTIVAVGEDLKVPHKVGDRVHVIGPGCLGLGDGCWAEYVLKDSESCSPIMEGLSLQEAASHWINPGTAYMMAKIVKDGNHKAAIHTAGTSALGKMMIRYFKQQGITLINIVRRQEAIDELKKEGADYALNSKDPDFDKKLKEVCEKTQATCAFDAIGGDFTNRLLKCMPRKSTVYVYGVLSGGTGVDNLEWVELVKEKCVTSLLIYNYTNEMRSKGQLSKFFNEIHSLLPTVFKSQVLKIFRLDQLQEAIAYYKDNSSKGKILIQP